MRLASYVPGELIPLPLSGSIPELPHVAKVENRATRKISRKLIFGLLRRCVAFQRHYGDPWSILDVTIWSLTSPLVKRTSGSKKFRSSPQKDFCNNIGAKRPCGEPTITLEAKASLTSLSCRKAKELG